MQVLVTGGAGFIGSHLARRLMERGDGVVVADDCSSGRRDNLPQGAEHIQADLGSSDAMAFLDGRRFDAICHVAGQSSGEKSFDDPIRDFDSNARSTALLASWALRNGVQTFLHASSMSVYGQPASLPVSEDAPVDPLSYYGASKLAAERFLQLTARRGLRAVSFRMFSVYGPGQDMSEMRQGMASIYLAYMLRREPVAVRGTLDRVRDLVHVDDVVNAWIRALDQPVSGVLNIGTGVGTTVKDLIGELAVALGLDSDYPVEILSGTPGDQVRLFADTSRVTREVGWRARITLKDGLRQLAAWASTETTV